jgi:CubicO group peptidase (beta-lactamase class C family)
MQVRLCEGGLASPIKKIHIRDDPVYLRGLIADERTTFLKLGLRCMLNSHKKIVRLTVAFFLLAISLGSFATEGDAQWLDSVIGERVGNGGPPGASAVIVRSDGTMILKAWGKAGMNDAKAIDAEKTVFRIGSITKTFTAIAVLQLVEEKKISLDDDVNVHLRGIKVSAKKSPTKVRDLLGHRGGFDGDISTVGKNSAEEAKNASNDRLQRDIRQVRTPGKVSVYDNMAYGLLGHLVESVDGRPYAQSIEQRVLKPLGMSHTQVGLPASAENTAQAFEVGVDGKPQQKPQIYLRHGWQGAGEMSSTAADMGQFLLCMLNEGQHANGRLLSEEMFRAFTDTTNFTLTEGLPGVGLGLYALGGQFEKSYGHGGTIRGFNAVYMVMPRQKMAMFAVMNLNRPIPEMTIPGLADYISNPPGPGPINPTDFMLFELPYLAEQQFQMKTSQASNLTWDALTHSKPASSAKRWTGHYAYMRAEDNEALLPRIATALLLGPSEVSVNENGLMMVDGEGPYKEVKSNLFSLDGSAGPLTRTVGFSEVDGLTVMGPHTLLPNRRLAGYEVPLLTVGGLLLAPIGILLIALVRRHVTASAWPTVDWRAVGAGFAFLAFLMIELAGAPTFQREFDLGWVVSLWRFILHIAVFGLVWNCFSAWRSHALTLRTSFYALVQTMFTVWIVLAAGYWHVLGTL